MAIHIQAEHERNTQNNDPKAEQRAEH